MKKFILSLAFIGWSIAIFAQGAGCSVQIDQYPGQGFVLLAATGSFSQIQWNPGGSTATTINVTQPGLYTAHVWGFSPTGEPCESETTVNVTSIPTGVDNIPPTITCPASLTVNNTFGACSAVVIYSMPTATDNSGTANVTLQSGQPSGSTFNVGVSTVVFKATDPSGNTATCSFTITVRDNQAPTALCKNATIALGQNGQVTLLPSAINNSSYDNCAVTNLTVSQANFTCTNIGSHCVTLTATDAAGNTGTCQTSVTVVDNTPPTIVCPNNITANAGNNCTAMVSYNMQTATDNCGTANMSLVSGQSAGSSFSLGTTSVTYRATDASGNSATCSFSVTVTDNTPPAITCPPSSTLYTSASNCGVGYNYSVTTTDNCANANVSFVNGMQSGSTFPVGTTTNTWRATDPANNSATCSFSVTVLDQQKPSITCPAGIVQSAAFGQCGANITFANATATDNCGNLTVTNLGLPSGSNFPIGTTTVNFRATDASGNSSTCSFTITVNDKQAPTITCPSSQTVNTTNCSAAVAYGQPNVSDNCGNPTISLMSGQPTGALFQVGTTMVTYKATDASDNATFCAFTITVNGQKSISPVTATASGTYNVTITDVCTGQTTTSSVLVTVPPCPSQGCTLVAVGTGISATCGQSGMIDLTVKGGQPEYSYQWTNGSINQDPTNLPPGTYVVTVTDATGVCTATASVTVPQPVVMTSISALTISASGDYNTTATFSNGCTQTLSQWVTVNCPQQGVEVCNGVDDNGNGQIDEGVQNTFYLDADGDGHGNPFVTILACDRPNGYAFSNMDCNDSNAAIHPGATELDNNFDDNCNGQIDEGFAPILPWYIQSQTVAPGFTQDIGSNFAVVCVGQVTLTAVGGIDYNWPNSVLTGTNYNSQGMTFNLSTPGDSWYLCKITDASLIIHEITMHLDARTCVTGVSDDRGPDPEFTLGPNPTTGALNIDLSGQPDGNYGVNVINLATGQQVTKQVVKVHE